jgi:hypothetical protein
MEIKMKTVSNIAAGLGLLIVVVSFVLNAAGLAAINMDDAIKAGGFVKTVFLPVDASVWINNVFGKQDSSGASYAVKRITNKERRCAEQTNDFFYTCRLLYCLRLRRVCYGPGSRSRRHICRCI